jgi:hypothetical protein
MASITKGYSNELIIQGDNSTQPTIIANWAGATVSYGADWVLLSVGNKGFKFTTDWGKSAVGPLLSINGLDVSNSGTYTNSIKADLVERLVLTPDKFSGTPVNAVAGTTYTGKFTGIHALTNVQLDTAVSVQLGSGVSANNISAYSAAIFQGDTVYGSWSTIKVTSGTAILYSAI